MSLQDFWKSCTTLLERTAEEELNSFQARIAPPPESKAVSTKRMLHAKKTYVGVVEVLLH
jgi:hypothetical protein